MTTFHPQPQAIGLNATGLDALGRLRDKTSEQALQKNLEEAKNRLVQVAAALNERAYQRKHDFAQKSRRQGSEVDDDDGAGEEEFQQRITALTKDMDLAVRQVVDSKLWQDTLPDAVEHIAKRAEEVAQPPPGHGPRQRRRSNDNADASEAEQSQEESFAQPDQSKTPSALLQSFLTAKQTSRRDQTLTQRYSRNNDYIEFYNSVYSAENDPDNPPPVPHADFWFAEEEGREIHHNQDHDIQSGEEQDSDFEIRSERIDTRCPLTLKPLANPWKSTVCPHSFEKDDMINFIRASENYRLTPEQRAEVARLRRADDKVRRTKEIGVPQAGCPICNKLIIEAELIPNPGLARRIQRIIEKDRREAEAAANEDSSDDDGLPRGTQRRPAHLGSESPTERRGSLPTVKPEGRFSSVRPGTQLSQRNTPGARRSSDVDLTNDFEEDEEMMDA